MLFCLFCTVNRQLCDVIDTKVDLIETILINFYITTRIYHIIKNICYELIKQICPLDVWAVRLFPFSYGVGYLTVL